MPLDSKGSLDEVFCSLSQQVLAFEEKPQKELTREELLDVAMLTTAQALASAMRADEAMVLPVLHRSFIAQVKHRAVQFPVQCIPEQDIPESRWLLTRLHALGTSSGTCCGLDESDVHRNGLHE